MSICQVQINVSQKNILDYGLVLLPNKETARVTITKEEKRKDTAKSTEFLNSLT